MRRWDSSKKKASITSRWSGDPEYLRQYEAAYEILSDEDTVTRGLRKLAESATSLDGIKAELGRIEGQHGFAETVLIIPSLLDHLIFLGILCSKQAFLDLGTFPTHGSLTQRYQWAILADTLVPPAPIKLGDLYAGLSSPGTYHAVPHPRGGIEVTASLWKDVFDAPFDVKKPRDSVHTASSPEFLMYYMNNHSDARFRTLHDHSVKVGLSPLPPDAFSNKLPDGGR